MPSCSSNTFWNNLLDMQQSQRFGETHNGRWDQILEACVVLWMLLGIAFHKVLTMCVSYHQFVVCTMEGKGREGKGREANGSEWKGREVQPYTFQLFGIYVFLTYLTLHMCQSLMRILTHDNYVFWMLPTILRNYSH